MRKVVREAVKEAIGTQPVMSESMFQLKSNMHLHLVGIGGAGMSAIARVLMGRGVAVSGSDQQLNELTTALALDGAKIYQGHSPENIGAAEALVISSAIPTSNPEVVAAQALGVPVLKRADLLGALMNDTIGIAVAGTHGKTTTAAMIAQLLIEAELDPTVILGGVMPSLGTNGRHGKGEHFVIEADEYDRMFMGLRPQTIVITNLEHDHPDMFPTMDDYMAAFRDFVALLPVAGRVVACIDDPGAVRLLAGVRLSGIEVVRYGLTKEEGQKSTADIVALDCRSNPLGGTDFLVESNGQVIGLARLRVPGAHNVRNALAAISVALESGVEFSVIRQGLAAFGGVGRRFQVVGEAGGVTVIDDYAHHPTEIEATLAAARQRYPGRRMWAVWQPHTFSRTNLLHSEFAASLGEADRVVGLDIFGSRERESMGLDTQAVIAEMNHPGAVHIADLDEAAGYILDRVRPDDVVITLSAGDGNLVGKWVLEGLRKRLNEE